MGSESFGAGFVESVGCGEDDAHAPMAIDFGLAEYAHLHARFRQDLLEVVKLYLVGVPSTTIARDAEGP